MTIEASVVDKIRKIQACAESAKNIGNEEEAQLFASKMQELMLRHELSMTDIQFKEELTNIGEETITWVNEGLESKKRCSWMEQIISMVCKVHACRFLVYNSSNQICVIGHEKNRELAVHSIITLVRCADKLSTKAYQQFYYKCKASGMEDQAKGYRASWLRGFISRIYYRLEEMNKVQEEVKTQNMHSDSTALVRLNKKAEEVNTYIQELNVRTVKQLKKKSAANICGLRDGHRSANQVNLVQKVVKSSETRNNYIAS